MAVRATGSAQEAIAWVRDGARFDVALIDYQMPDQDGVGLATALGEITEPRPMPVVITSSVGHRTRAVGNVAAWLTKPIKPSPLLDALHGVLTAVARMPAPAEPVVESTVPLGERHPLRILIAEDNAMSQKLALRLLELLGYTPAMAGNGLEAMAALEADTFDVVLMDVHMPELDGLEATRRIRQRWPGAAGPHIVAMTANAMAGDREVCLAAGMDDYISKPIRVEELAAALEATPRMAKESVHMPETLDQVALANLLAMVGNDPAFVDELVDEYLADAPQQASAVRAALDAGDAEGLVRPAHTLKGTSLSLGGVRVAEIAMAIEARGRAGDLDGIDVLLADLDAARIELAAALDQARAHRWAGA